MTGRTRRSRGQLRGNAGRVAPTLAQYLRLRRRRPLWLAAVATAVLMSLIWADHHNLLLYRRDPMLARYDGRVFTVVRVLDGQTFEIDSPVGGSAVTRVTMCGIETRYRGHRDAGDPAGPFTQMATALVRRFAEGKAVRLELVPRYPDGDFGVLRAYVELPDGTMLNEQLLVEGLARADDRWVHLHQERFDLLQKQAAMDKLGVWSLRP